MRLERDAAVKAKVEMRAERDAAIEETARMQAELKTAVELLGRMSGRLGQLVEAHAEPLTGRVLSTSKARVSTGVSSERRRDAE